MNLHYILVCEVVNSQLSNNKEYMNKLLFGIMLTFLAFSFLKSSRKAQEINAVDEKLHEQCIYPTVKITHGDESGGSGFIVRSAQVGDKWHNTVITAAHIVEDEDILEVHVAEYQNWSEIKDYKKYRMISYAIDSNRDLAVAYFVSDQKMPVAKLHFESKLYINTEVFHCGYALLDDVRIDYGQITQPKTLLPKGFHDLIRANCFAFMGDSGGPLFSKDNYFAIAICVGIRSHNHTALPNVSYYRPISDLKTWDAELNNALESVYTESAALPLLPFVKLKLKEYKYQLPE
jgi:small basic protein